MDVDADAEEDGDDDDDGKVGILAVKLAYSSDLGGLG
jgi:hypothetical protein